jgi:hypothetical protein
MLNYYDDFWDLRLDECPCDLDFLGWLAARNVSGAAIFHFGTGGHHLVGTREAESGRGNVVLGITASPHEYQAYMQLVIDRPQVGRAYKVLFGDIYQLDARLLPVFDIVTLFHLGEYRTERNDAYGAHPEEDLIALMAGRLRPGGHMLFYTGSTGFPAAEPTITRVMDRLGLARQAEHKTLWVYRSATR